MNKKEVMRQALGNIDDRLIAEELEAYENEPVRRKNRKNLLKKAPLWAAAMLLLILLGGTTVYAIMRFQSEVKKEEGMISFSLDAESYRVDESLIKGQILEAKEITKKQYEQWTVYVFDLPGYYSKEFSKAEEAKAYVGYEKLTIPRLNEQRESSAKVLTFVSETQKFESVNISVLYSPYEGVYITENAYIWTKDCTEEPGVGLIGERINDYAKTEHRTANGREFLIVTLKNLSENDYVNYTAYWAEDTVLYGLSLLYTDSEEHEAEAEKLMLQWMNSF